jgi:hypothetical protein
MSYFIMLLIGVVMGGAYYWWQSLDWWKHIEAGCVCGCLVVSGFGAMLLLLYIAIAFKWGCWDYLGIFYAGAIGSYLLFLIGEWMSAVLLCGVCTPPKEPHEERDGS